MSDIEKTAALPETLEAPVKGKILPTLTALVCWALEIPKISAALELRARMAFQFIKTSKR